ncbi:unnamed protein product [Calicophoron daubneyi]|uniref:ISXO2-like transposase domain-containing protein n=1 Tax=Calicophoron daubneyi TaxID=300641 RepID=A0AAV2TYG5_CALDB
MSSMESKKPRLYEDYEYQNFEIHDLDSAEHHGLASECPDMDPLDEEPNDMLDLEPHDQYSPPPTGSSNGSDYGEELKKEEEEDSDGGSNTPNPLANVDFPCLELNEKGRIRICKRPFSKELEWSSEEFDKDSFRSLVLDQTKLIVWLAKRRLIPNESYCVHCPSPIALGLSKEISHVDTYVWRCRKCSKRCTIRSRSIFDRLKTPMDVLVYVMFMWAEGNTVAEICEEVGVSSNVVLPFITRLRAICSWHLKRETDRLEGVVEIAEGAYLDPPRICALAGVERFGTKCFLIRLPQERCNQKLLIRFIRHRIEPGSTIITSDWPGYGPLGELPEGYAHLVADPQRNITLRKADELLEQLAAFIDNLQMDCREQFSSILDEFVWRKVCPENRFAKALYSLAHLYNVS